MPKFQVFASGKRSQPKLAWIHKVSWTSPPTGSRPTSPTIPPGTTDQNSCRLSTPRTPRSSLPTRTPSRWQRRRTTRSWTWCRTPPSPTPTTLQPGSTTPGWLVAAKRLQLSFGFPQVILLCVKYNIIFSKNIPGGGEVSVATSQKIEAKDLATWVGGQQQTLEWEATSRFSNLWKTKLPPGSHFEAAVGLDGQRCVCLD